MTAKKLKRQLLAGSYNNNDITLRLVGMACGWQSDLRNLVTTWVKQDKTGMEKVTSGTSIPMTGVL